MISQSIEKSFKILRERKWDKTYWAIDLHDTVLLSNYSNGIPNEFYPLAKETLQIISNRSDIVMIMYTCSYPDEILKYLEFFESNGIHFNYVNENPEANNTSYGYYDKKPYFNVLLDDKAGFDANNDWIIVKNLLEKNI